MDKNLIIEDILKLLKLYFKVRKEDIVLIKQTINEAFIYDLRLMFSKIKNKYFCDADKNPIYNPVNSTQKLIILYKLSNNIIFKNKDLGEKIYYLNKILNSCEIYPEVQLPKVFFAEHPVGSVLGRATYGNFFVFQQNCTVGSNKGKYPKIGNNVRLFSGAMILGNSKIGNNVFVSAGTIIKDDDIPSFSVVYGSSPNLIIKSKGKDFFRDNSIFLK